MTARVVFISAKQVKSGKDLSANYLQSFFTDLGYNCEVHAFKDKLIELAAAFVGESVEDFIEYYDSQVRDLPDFEQSIAKWETEKWWKDVPLYHMEGGEMSKRELLIYISEKVIKPVFGEDFFGQAAAKRIDNQDIIIYSDSGFVSEVIPVIEKVGKDNCLVVQLIREGYYSGIKDSRKLLEPEDFPEHLRPQFVQVINPNIEGWQEVLEQNLRLKVANKILEGM